MVAGAGLQQLSSWKQEPTTVRAVATALAELWRRSAPEEGETEAQRVVMRTSVMNLVLYASSRGVSERAASAIAHLAGTHPSRSLLILAEPSAPTASLGASLQALCREHGGGRRFCFEQIAITARGGTVEHLPGIITQLTLHDLPTLLWWPGDPPLTDPFFARMVAVCDSIVVDSSDFADPEAGLRGLAEFARTHRGRVAVNDLNWDRLTDWRELVAQFFDAPMMLPLAQKIRRVRIDYAFDSGGQENSAQGLLLSAWLGSRLGWELERAERTDAGDHLLRLHGGDGDVEVRVRSLPGRHAAPGAVVALRLESEDEGETAAFTIAADDEAEHATTTATVGSGNPVSRTVHLEERPESALLSEEIEAVGRERAYEDALHMAGTFAHQAGSEPTRTDQGRFAE